MGYYINPPDCSKEQWLTNNAVEVACAPTSIKPDSRPVCLVDNGPFTAAAIAFDLAELNYFKQTSDYRPKRWFVVQLDKLVMVEPAAQQWVV